MASGKKNDEIVECFYGINSKTFDVESVSLTQGGVLSKWGRDGTYLTHPVLYGRSPQAEVALVFELKDIFRVRSEFDSPHTKERIEELKTRASIMKREAGAD